MRYRWVAVLFLASAPCFAETPRDASDFLETLEWLTGKNLSFERPVELEVAYRALMARRPPRWIADPLLNFWRKYNALSPDEKHAQELYKLEGKGSFFATAMDGIEKHLEEIRTIDDAGGNRPFYQDLPLTVFINNGLQAFLESHPSDVQALALLDRVFAMGSDFFVRGFDIRALPKLVDYCISLPLPENAVTGILVTAARYNYFNEKRPIALKAVFEKYQSFYPAESMEASFVRLLSKEFVPDGILDGADFGFSREQQVEIFVKAFEVAKDLDRQNDLLRSLHIKFIKNPDLAAMYARQGRAWWKFLLRIPECQHMVALTAKASLKGEAAPNFLLGPK